MIQLAFGAFHYISGKMPKQGARIETPTATIGVRGTRLLIGVSSSGATTVAVIEGAVEVVSRADGSATDVEAGGSVAVGVGRQATTTTQGIIHTGDPIVDSAAQATNADGKAGGNNINSPVGDDVEVDEDEDEQAQSDADSADQQAASDAESAAQQAVSDAESAAQQAASDAASAAQQAASDAESAAQQAASDAESGN